MRNNKFLHYLSFQFGANLKGNYFLFFSFLFETEGQQSQCQMHMKQGKRAHHKWRWGPSDAKHRHIKNNTNITPPRTTPRTHLTKKNPPTIKLPIKKLSYPTTLPLLLPCDNQIVPPTKDVPTPHIWCIAVMEKLLILICLTTHSHAALA